MKTTFTCSHDDIKGNEITRVVYETNNEVLSDIIEDFTYFLRGCGFMIGDQKLALVSESAFYDEILGRHEEDYHAN